MSRNNQGLLISLVVLVLFTLIGPLLGGGMMGSGMMWGPQDDPQGAGGWA